MNKTRNTIIVLGEGPTETFYVSSLQDRFRGLQISPKIPKHSSLKELENKIAELQSDYEYILCLIDMDNKQREPEHSQYLNLRKKYAAPVVNKKKHSKCNVLFFETNRCTELFFLYYFQYTKKKYNTSADISVDLNAHCKYEKTQKFFKKHPLHSYFESQGGCLATAVSNADRSIAQEKGNTYSELGKFIECLEKLRGNK